MDEQIVQAIEMFNSDNSRSDKAQGIIDTLISCFGDAYVNVVRCKVGPNNYGYIESRINRNTTLEQKVDFLKSLFPFWNIIIKFPHEVVTNEYGKKTNIYDFFVKVVIRHNGTYYNIEAIKSTFTDFQFYSGYVHSHCPSLIREEQGIKQWKSMCFGSGPINGTIRDLCSPDCMETRWIAFATELRQWVRTESTDGGPYFRIDHITNKYDEVLKDTPYRPSSDNVNKILWIPLIKSYIRAKGLKVGFVGGKYCLGIPFTEWLKDFSGYAKVWAEKNKKHLEFIDTLIVNNRICRISNNYNPRQRDADLIGKTVLKFKGEDVPLKVIEEGDKAEHCNLLNYRIGLYIVKNLLNIINYKYGMEDAAERTIPVQWG